MTKSFILWSAALLFLLPMSQAWAQEGSPSSRVPPAAPGRQEIESTRAREMLDTMMIWKLTKALDLTEEQSLRVFPKIQALQKTRKEFFQEKMRRHRDLFKQLRDDPKNEEAIRMKIQAIRDHEADFRAKEARLKEEITGHLSLRQQAELILFEERFPREVRHTLEEIRRSDHPSKATAPPREMRRRLPPPPPGE
jgi:hypothetical protein